LNPIPRRALLQGSVTIDSFVASSIRRRSPGQRPPLTRAPPGRAATTSGGVSIHERRQTEEANKSARAAAPRRSTPTSIKEGEENENVANVEVAAEEQPGEEEEVGGRSSVARPAAEAGPGKHCSKHPSKKFEPSFLE